MPLQHADSETALLSSLQRHADSAQSPPSAPTSAAHSHDAAPNEARGDGSRSRDASGRGLASWPPSSERGSASSSSPLVDRSRDMSSSKHFDRDGLGVPPGEDDMAFLSDVKHVGGHATASLFPADPDSVVWRLKRNMSDMFIKQSNAQLLALQHTAPQYALFFFRQRNWLRHAAMVMATNRIFESLMLASILANCVTLALYSNKPSFATSTLGKDLQNANIAFLAIFCFEAAVKIVAMGFILAPGTYMRSGWNVLDFIVVTLGIIDALGIGGTTAIRSVRVLRPLRAITKIEAMRILVVTIIKAAPMMIDVAVLSLFYFAIFGVLGVQLFGGKLTGRCGWPIFDSVTLGEADDLGARLAGNVTYYVPTAEQQDVCRGPRAEDLSWTTADNGTTFNVQGLRIARTGRICSYGHLDGQSTGPPVADYLKMICIPYQDPQTGGGNIGWRHWNNILFALLNLFEILNMTSWVYIMYDTQDAVSSWVWPLFVIETILGAFFLVNLAVAVMYLQFQKDRDASELELQAKRAAVLAERRAEEQHMLVPDALADPDGLMADYDSSDDGKGTEDGKGNASTVRSEDVVVDPHYQNRFRGWCYDLMRDPRVENFTMSMIVLNCIFMALQWYPMPHKLDQANNWANVGFTFYFVLEMVFKLIGMGFAEYGADSYNVFDAFVVVASLVDVIIFMLPNVSNTLGSAFSVLRGFRLLKIFRLLVRWRGLARLLTVMVESLSSVGWLTLLLFLVIFVWALLGMQIFGFKLKYCTNVNNSFSTCPPGLSLDECTDHGDCYISCDSFDAHTWINMPGSPYGNMAYCEQFPRTGPAPYVYLAQVGKPYVPDANFDSVVQAFVVVFQILTLDNWDQTMYTCLAVVGPWASLYFVAIIAVGDFMLLNLFLAILIHGFESLSQGEHAVIGHAQNCLDGDQHADAVPDVLTHGVGVYGHRDAEYAVKVGHEQLWAANGSGHPMLEKEDSAPSWSHPAMPKHPVHIDSSARTGDEDIPKGGKLQEEDSFQAVQKLRALSLSAARHNGVAVLRPHVDYLHMSSSIARHTSAAAAEEFKGGAGAGFGSNIVRNITLAKTTIDEDAAAAAGEASHHPGMSHGPASHHYHNLTRPADLPVEDASLRRKKRITQLCKGNSLFVLGPTNPLRIAVAHVLVTKTFANAMLFFILLSSVSLTLDTAYVDKQSNLGRTLLVLNYICAVAFSLEAAAKIVVRGFLFCGKQSYLRHPWNVMDLLIVIVSLVVIITEAIVGNNKQVSWLRAFRAVRALRPLRAATRFASIRVVVDAMFQAIPALGNVVFVTLIFYIIFGVLAINLFAGGYNQCQDSGGTILDAYYAFPLGGKINSTWCDGTTYSVTSSYYHSQLNVSVPAWNQTTAWVRPFVNFDNLGIAALVLFQMSTLENWGPIMYSGGWSVGPEQQPEQQHNRWVQLYFVAFIIVGSFLLSKLIVGVTIDKFNELSRSKTGKSGPLLTAEQEEWLTIQKMLVATRLKTGYAPPDDAFRYTIFAFVFSDVFEFGMIAIIVLNIFAMMTDHANKSPGWVLATEIYNIVFTGIFVLEMLLKWIAVGLPAYFKDNWNRFDFVVVLVSVAGVLSDLLTTEQLTFLPLLRILRAVRIFKVIPKAKGLRMLLQTLLWSLPAVFNVGTVLFLFMFVYAIIGMNLFGTNMWDSSGNGITRHSNFQSFLSSMMLMFRLITGSNWDVVMEDCMTHTGCVLIKNDYTTPDGLINSPAGTYVDPRSAALAGIPTSMMFDQCSPNSVFSLIFSTTYQVFCSLMLLQLVIGVILANIQSTTYTEELTVGQSHILRFVEVWEELDPWATSFIPVSWVTHLLISLKPPLGVMGLSNQLMQVHNIVTSVDIPNRDNKVHFLETLHALAGRVAGAELPIEHEFLIHKVLTERLPNKEMPKYTAAHFYSAMYVQSAVRGFLARRKLRLLWEAQAPEDEDEDGDLPYGGSSERDSHGASMRSVGTVADGKPRGAAGRELTKEQQEAILRSLHEQQEAALSVAGVRPGAVATAAGRRALVAHQTRHVQEVQQHNMRVSDNGLPTTAMPSTTSRAGDASARGLFKLSRRTDGSNRSGAAHGNVELSTPSRFATAMDYDLSSPGRDDEAELGGFRMSNNGMQTAWSPRRMDADDPSGRFNARRMDPDDPSGRFNARRMDGDDPSGRFNPQQTSSGAARASVYSSVLAATQFMRVSKSPDTSTAGGSPPLRSAMRGAGAGVPSNAVAPSGPSGTTMRRRPKVGMSNMLGGGGGGGGLVSSAGGYEYAPSVMMNPDAVARDAVLDGAGRMMFKHASLARRHPEAPKPLLDHGSSAALDDNDWA